MNRNFETGVEAISSDSVLVKVGTAANVSDPDPERAEIALSRLHDREPEFIVRVLMDWGRIPGNRRLKNGEHGRRREDQRANSVMRMTPHWRTSPSKLLLLFLTDK